MKTEVDVPNASLVLVPGMYADVDLTTEQRNIVLSVPTEEIDGHGDCASVYVVQPSGAIQVVPVRLGIETAQRAEILSGGLREGDRVVVGSRAGLKAGEKVHPKVISLAADASPKS